MYHYQNTAIAASMKGGASKSFSTSPTDVSPKPPALPVTGALTPQEMADMEAEVNPAAAYFRDVLVDGKTRAELGILPTGPSSLVSDALFLHCIDQQI